MSNQNHQTTVPIDPNNDPYGYVGMVRHSDGSITRLHESVSPVDTSCNLSNLVVTKDLAINTSKKTWARIILPRQVLLEHPTCKLPLVIYFHGGGFIVASVDAPTFQGFYELIASEIPAVVVSIEYRRAPEHRLPAAYDDSMEALHWIKNKPNEWLANYADFSKCFLMGTSAGANITYHLGLGLGSAAATNNIKPLEIKGLILHQPFFGGNERTESELRLVNDKVLPLSLTDIMWELALPEGANRDHEYSNPMVAFKTNPNLFDQMGWKILVTGCDGDPLIDRQITFVRALKKDLGVHVVDTFTQGGCHGLEIIDPSKGKEFLIVLKEFVTAA